MTDLTYFDKYCDVHDAHHMSTVANILKDACGTDSVFMDCDRLIITVYGVDKTLIDTIVGMFGTVYDTDYGVDYDYDENPVSDFDCVDVFFDTCLIDCDSL